MFVSGFFTRTSANLSKFALAVEVRFEELKSKLTVFSPKVILIPSPTLSTSAPGKASLIALACLSILLPITPPATPPTTPPRTAPSSEFLPLPMLFPKIPPRTAPAAVPITAPFCVLFAFCTASQLVKTIVEDKNNAATLYLLINFIICFF